MVDLNKLISSAMKSGKMLLGSKQAMDAAKSGRVAAIIVALNCPKRTRLDIERYSDLSRVPLYLYPASSPDLGVACGKPFPVLALAIRETTDPDVIKMRRELREASNNKRE